MLGREDSMTAIRHFRVHLRNSLYQRRGVRSVFVALTLLTIATALGAADAAAHDRSSRHHRRGGRARAVVVERTMPRAVDRAHGHCVVVSPQAVPFVTPLAPYCAAVPGYVGSPVIFCGSGRFQWSASLELYVPNLRFEAGYGEWAPRGSVYWDPYCGNSYRCLSDYRAHIHRCGHPAAVTLAVGWPTCR